LVIEFGQFGKATQSWVYGRYQTKVTVESVELDKYIAIMLDYWGIKSVKAGNRTSRFQAGLKRAGDGVNRC
jgi:hypothetical protein